MLCGWYIYISTSLYLVLAGHLESWVQVFNLVLQTILLLLESGEMGALLNFNSIISYFTHTIHHILEYVRAVTIIMFQIQYTYRWGCSCRMCAWLTCSWPWSSCPPGRTSRWRLPGTSCGELRWRTRVGGQPPRGHGGAWGALAHVSCWAQPVDVMYHVYIKVYCTTNSLASFLVLSMKAWEIMINYLIECVLKLSIGMSTRRCIQRYKPINI